MGLLKIESVVPEVISPPSLEEKLQRLISLYTSVMVRSLTDVEGLLLEELYEEERIEIEKIEGELKDLGLQTRVRLAFEISAVRGPGIKVH